MLICFPHVGSVGMEARHWADQRHQDGRGRWGISVKGQEGMVSNSPTTLWDLISHDAGLPSRVCPKARLVHMLYIHTQTPGGTLNSNKLTSDIKRCHLLALTSLSSMRSDTNVVDLMGHKWAACWLPLKNSVWQIWLTTKENMTKIMFSASHISFVWEYWDCGPVIDRIQKFTYP